LVFAGCVFIGSPQPVGHQHFSTLALKVEVGQSKIVSSEQFEMLLI
jgi:hypothetical protein